jgi:hypothetical protein
LGVVVAGNLFPDAFPSPAAGVVIAAVLLVTAPVHWWIGRALNSTVTPQGRVWHDSHTYFGAPIQKGVGVNIAFALIAVSIAAGAATSPIVGWAVLVGTPIVAWLVWASRADGARLRTIEDRKPLAAERGWRYKNSDARLATRWKARERGGLPYTAHPFGIVAGELNGLPFTAFDTEATDWGRYTTWAVHLPLAYPKIVVRGPSAPPSPDSPRPWTRSSVQRAHRMGPRRRAWPTCWPGWRRSRRSRATPGSRRRSPPRRCARRPRTGACRAGCSTAAT